MAVPNSLCLSCKTCMGDMPYLTRAGKNAYSAETYVGNWYEETVRNTIRRDDFLRRRECGELKIQRTQTMIDLLLKPVELSLKNEQYLHYGDTLQIVSPGPSCAIAKDEYPYKRGHCRQGHLALSSCVPPHAIDHAPYLSTDSLMSASPLLFPVVRNSFVIENPHSGCSTDIVNYGDVFRIRALPTQHFNLYLFSSPANRLHQAANHSAKPKVRLSDVASWDTLWSAWPMDPAEEIRMELGVPVPIKKRLYIKHNGSGIHLSTEPKFPVLTYFGQEVEVTTDTKTDRVRRIFYPNIWYFDADRGKLKPDDELKKFMLDSKHDASVNIYNTDKSAAEEEKLKEDCKREALENDDDEDCPSYAVRQEICRIDENDFRESLRKMDEPKGLNAGGQLPFDPMTGPQPNAYTYKVFKDDKSYPNMKWACGKTDCCNLRVPQKEVPEEQKYQDCKCKCIEPTDPLPNPNVRDYLLNGLIR